MIGVCERRAGVGRDGGGGGWEVVDVDLLCLGVSYFSWSICEAFCRCDLVILFFGRKIWFGIAALMVATFNSRTSEISSKT